MDFDLLLTLLCQLFVFGADDLAQCNLETMREMTFSTIKLSTKTLELLKNKSVPFSDAEKIADDFFSFQTLILVLCISHRYHMHIRLQGAVIRLNSLLLKRLFHLKNGPPNYLSVIKAAVLIFNITV